MALGLQDTMKKCFTPLDFNRFVRERFDSLVFDLDNTIYDEHDFLFDRYRAIAPRVAVGDVDLARSAFDFLRSRFLMEGRERLFDVFLKRFDLSMRFTVAELLACFRGPVTSLKTFDYFDPLVRHFRGPIYLVTNGNPRQQRNKLAALGISYRFDGVVLANEVQKKPSALALAPLLQVKGSLGRSLYIGDSDVDRDFATNCDLSFFQIAFDRYSTGLADQQTLHFQELPDSRRCLNDLPITP